MNTATTIDRARSLVTLINVYEVEPENQSKLLNILAQATEDLIRFQPGFVSVSLHSSLDRTRVVNYSQWASREDFERLSQNPDAQARFKHFASLAKSVSPSLYQVDFVHAL